MKISIITVCYNSEATVRDTVESVLSQEAVEVEYIVVDGGSSDQTVGILEGYRGGISQLVSEPDDGIYDAMNKGIAMSSGDIVGLLNADDFYANSHVLADVVAAFADPSVDAVYADLDYVDAEDVADVVRKWRSSPYENGAFRSGWHPAHPTLFVRRSVYRSYGYFDLSLPIAADYEFMLRAMERHRIKSLYLPKVLVKMRAGGASNGSLKNIMQANYQCWQALRKNGLGASPLPVLRKMFSKLRQF